MISPLALGVAALALAGLALIWAGVEALQCHRRLSALEDKQMALEARQLRLQRIVEKGWSQSLDLTAFDWSLQASSDTEPDISLPPRRR